jgi:protein-disulfide isomerase
MASAEVEQAVETDFAEGQAIGVTGTPAFVINGVPVIGAQPTEVFEQTIEKAAQDAGS